MVIDFSLAPRARLPDGLRVPALIWMSPLNVFGAANGEGAGAVLGEGAAAIDLVSANSAKNS
jgi:hypothetical protein